MKTKYKYGDPLLDPKFQKPMRPSLALEVALCAPPGMRKVIDTLLGQSTRKR